jgi:hypothetical protein
MRTVVDEGGLVCRVLFSLYVKDKPRTSRYVELAQYADDTVAVVTSLLVGYLETYLGILGFGCGI